MVTILHQQDTCAAFCREKRRPQCLLFDLHELGDGLMNWWFEMIHSILRRFLVSDESLCDLKVFSKKSANSVYLLTFDFYSLALNVTYTICTLSTYYTILKIFFSHV